MAENSQQNAISPEDEADPWSAIDEMNASNDRAGAALDEALEHVGKSEERPRKKYRLADLLLEIPEGDPIEDREIREWMDMKPVGCEFGASVMEKFARFSPEFMEEGRGDQEQAERDFNPTGEN